MTGAWGEDFWDPESLQQGRWYALSIVLCNLLQHLHRSYLGLFRKVPGEGLCYERLGGILAFNRQQG